MNFIDFKNKKDNCTTMIFSYFCLKKKQKRLRDEACFFFCHQAR